MGKCADTPGDEGDMELVLCSSFCSTCQEIFTGDIGRFENSSWFLHHRSLSAIECAVHEECYICSRSWISAILENADFFKLSPGGSEINFSMGYQISMEHDANGGSSEGPWNTIRIILACDRQQVGVPNIRHMDNFFAFSSRDFPRAIHRPRNPSSSRTLGTAKAWLQKCLASTNVKHEACNRLRISGWAPTRVIQVTGRDPDLWYVRVPAEEALEIQNYTTLSYRWGSNPFVKLTSSNIQAFRRGTAISVLPKTFQDAIKATRSLGIDFLWIDALCIVQDSQEDWRKESLAMYDVYKNSACTIAATASHSPYEGLFHQSTSSKGKLGDIKPTWSNLHNPSLASLEYIDTVVGFHHASEEVDTSPLTLRAWIFQEFLLSPRVLHFLESQIYWKCHAGSNCETFPNGLLQAPVWDKIDFVDHEQNGIPWSHSWKNVITRYSRCNATDPSDKLIALSGVANFFMKQTKDLYIAGMWRSELDSMLLWKVSNSSTLRPRATPYRAPTWSWASINSAVDYWDPSHSNPHLLVTILEVSAKTTSDNSTGHVIGGVLLLRGMAIKLRFVGSVPNTERTKWLLGNHVYIGTVIFDIVDEALTSIPLEFLAMDVSGRHIGSNIGLGEDSPWCYTYQTPFKLRGLVLKSCSPSSSQYSRVGFFEMKFGLSEKEVLKLKDPNALLYGLDSRMDAPNTFSLAEPFGFKKQDEKSVTWLKNKALLQKFEIL